MKGIILAGGTGSRLRPLTAVTNKHLLPVGRYPMLYHLVQELHDCDITEIAVVTGEEHMGAIVSTLGSGNDWGLDFTYKVQDEAGGIAQALGLCERWAGEEPVMVLLGDNIFELPLRGGQVLYRDQGAMIFLKSVHDPSRFGVAQLQAGDARILKILEKPTVVPPYSFAVVGSYVYDSQVWEIIRSLKPSDRGELEITDVNNAYLERGELDYAFIHGWWTDAGTHESYQQANHLAREKRLPLFDRSRFV